MNFSKLNLLAAWFLLPETWVLGFVSFFGRMVLELLGVSLPEGSIPSIVVGMLLNLAVVLTIYFMRGKVWPIGNPAGKGFQLGQRLVLAANVLAVIILIFRLTGHQIINHDLHMIADQFTDAFGYWAMAMWAIGFSFLYQSSMNNQVKD
ncbi:MAG: hypothetical protein RLZZ144_954 [Pseudomonadota bacterium]